MEELPETGQGDQNNKSNQQISNENNEEQNVGEEGYDTETESNEEPETNNQEIILRAAQENLQEIEEKHCWVCLGCEMDDPTASWTHPCR